MENHMAEFLAFRLGSGNRRDLDGVNAASFQGAIEFAYKAADKHVAHGDTLEVWRVKGTTPFGEYELFRHGTKAGSGQTHGLIGRKKTGWGYWYSFPKGASFTARKIGSVKLDVLGKLAGWTPATGWNSPGAWYISELAIDVEHKAAEKAFGMRIPKE